MLQNIVQHFNSLGCGGDNNYLFTNKQRQIQFYALNYIFIIIIIIIIY
jgi:hypothetical protein